MVEAVYKVDMGGWVFKTDDPLEAALVRLEKIKEARLREARDRGVAGKASVVAEWLGGYVGVGVCVYPSEAKSEVVVGDSGISDESLVRASLRFGLVIMYCHARESVRIYWRGREVFTLTNGAIERYVPGEWLDELESVYVEALRRKAETETEERIRRIVEECERWGVDPAELLPEG